MADEFLIVIWGPGDIERLERDDQLWRAMRDEEREPEWVISCKPVGGRLVTHGYRETLADVTADYEADERHYKARISV